MSYLADKVACTNCRELFDADLLDELGECHDCRMDRSFLNDIMEDGEYD